MTDDDDELTTHDPSLAAVLGSFRDETEPPPIGFAERLVDRMRRELWWRYPVRRLAHDRRTRYAAVSLGGALVGAAAIALLWRHAVRRAVGTSGVPA